MVATEKMRSHSESRGFHYGGGQNQQKSLGGPEGVQYSRLFTKEGCSLIEVLLYFAFLIKRYQSCFYFRQDRNGVKKIHEIF